MSDPDLTPLSPLTPLGAAAPRTERFGNIELRENVTRALVSVTARRGREAECARRLADFAGATPPEPGRHRAGPVHRMIWSGPEQVLLDAPFETHEDLAAIASEAFGDTASITEQTDAWARFDLSGPGLAEIFARLCPADLMTAGGDEAVRTAIEHMGVFLLCHGAGAAEGISLLGARSNAASLHEAVVEAVHSVS